MPTVVIADDSPTLRRIVSTVLEREGYTVVQAEDGVQAVQAVFRYMPDAVVLDVQMPRVSGYVAARLLKDDWRTAEIPLLLLTSLDAASDRYWGAQVGADRFLTKDFEAPQLVEAVHEVLSKADADRGGRPPLRPDPVEMQDDDVFGSISDLLDRKLFESSIAAEVTGIASEVHGFEETIAEVLDVLSRVVDYDLAAVLMLDDSSTYIRVARETSQQQYAEFFEAVADAATDSTGQQVSVDDLQARVADPEGNLGAEDEGEMATFLSMPLKAGGRMIGVLALSSARANAFGETSLNTLRLVSSPAGIVIANARYAGAQSV
ncbi:MAG TPA: response regulator [Actinomycetes bacterium]|nr:response regulator [Actinomycetes bacterium]